MFSIQLSAQELLGFHTAWDDSFREWVITTDDEGLEGELYLRWPNRDNWGEWDYNIGISSGEIRQKWQGNPNVWVLRGDGETINMRTVWRNDITQWRIDDGNDQVTLVSKYTNNLSDWYIRESDTFEMYSIRERDPRDWEVFEDPDLDLSLEMRLAISFIAIHHSSPKQ